jgi:hypothetical protein
MPVPRGAAPRALLGVIALIIAIAVMVAPVVDARPKDKKAGNQETVSAETPPGDDPAQSTEIADPALTAANGSAVEQTDVSNNGAGGDERTLLSSDADGDYLPDSLDNCPNVQNPDQADADGDGAGDACPVYQDSDGDGVADKEDNCPGLATYDYADQDGDGIGDACDKSPDGIEPEPEPLPDYGGQGGEGADELSAPDNGAGEDGESYERDGKTRSRQRSRTENSDPIITTGDDTADDDSAQSDGIGSDGEVITEGPDAVPYEEPARDNPRRNEELVAEAAASGELFAPPEPPPPAQRAWDEETPIETGWEPIVRIDSGVTKNATATSAAKDAQQGTQEERPSGEKRNRQSGDQSDEEAGDSGLARGWMRARVLLQEDAPTEPEEEGGDGERARDSAPVPVENGLVIKGNERESRQDDEQQEETATEESVAVAEPETGDGHTPEEAEQGDGAADDEDAVAETSPREDRSSRDERESRKDGSRRNGSSRAAAAPNRERSDSNGNKEQDAKKREEAPEKDDKGNAGNKKRDKGDRKSAARGEDEAVDWSNDRYFDGGSALDWTGDFEVAGTDDGQLYLTQRSGSGSGKRRGFTYAVPVEENGAYLVRLYFAEPYWGAPDGPQGEAGKRVFSVSAEGDAFIDDLDIYAEAGAMTALIKQAEVTVDDGELTLSFVASEGEPIVSAIEVLQPEG